MENHLGMGTHAGGSNTAGASATKRVKLLRRPEYFYGFKTHMSMNTDSELITSLTVTGGERYDGHQLPVLVEQDLAKEIPIETVTADRAYDDSANHYLLQTKGIQSALYS